MQVEPPKASAALCKEARCTDCAFACFLDAGGLRRPASLRCCSLVWNAFGSLGESSGSESTTFDGGGLERSAGAGWEGETNGIGSVK